MSDEKLKALLTLTEFIVEANDFERGYLWERYSPHCDWKDETMGASVVVGEFGGMPVNVTMFWSLLNGHRVMFYDAVSAVVDHRMVEKWLDENCNPKWDNGTRKARCNSLNFHHVLDAFNIRMRVPNE